MAVRTSSIRYTVLMHMAIHSFSTVMVAGQELVAAALGDLAAVPYSMAFLAFLVFMTAGEMCIRDSLMLLKGVIDCPDLPLNVSRSALQNDGFVKKISDYITKKVADKLSGMCKTDRENYEKYWDDINPFIKFGCLKDEKFRCV